MQRLTQSLRGRKLMIGVDRVDYSKGLLNRFKTFDRMLSENPKLKRSVQFLQIAVPSRSAIDSYSELQDKLAYQAGKINGRHGEVDWTPIRYLNKGFSQTTLAGFYRAAAVGLVTPFHDGMNLVAKEYVAAQNPENPGVLVLSEFAGAARELDAAVLVNPHDIDGMAQKLAVGDRHAAVGAHRTLDLDDEGAAAILHPCLVRGLHGCARPRRAPHSAANCRQRTSVAIRASGQRFKA